MTTPTESPKLTTAEKIVKCKAEIEMAKAYTEYFASMEMEELHTAWSKAVKRLTAELFDLMKQQQEEQKDTQS